MLTTFMLTVFAWIFFRAENISQAFNYVGGIFSESLFKVPYFNDDTNSIPTIIFTFVFVLIEWVGRNDKFAIEKPISNKFLRYTFYLILFFLLFFYVGFGAEEFIYFQF